MREGWMARTAVTVRQWLCFAMLAASPMLGHADAASGLAWLQSQVQPTGQLSSSSSAATTAQSQCEAVRTLPELAGPAKAAQLTAALDAAPLAETPTEVLACTQWLQQQQSQIPRSSELQGRRTASGGFATYDTLSGASALDTDWALQRWPAPGAQFRRRPPQCCCDKSLKI